MLGYKTSKPYIFTFRPSRFTSSHDSIKNLSLHLTNLIYFRGTKDFVTKYKLTMKEYEILFDKLYHESTAIRNRDLKLLFSKNSFQIETSQLDRIYEAFEKLDIPQFVFGFDRALSLIPGKYTIFTVSIIQDQKVTLSFDNIRIVGHVLENVCNLLLERKINVTNIPASPFDK